MRYIIRHVARGKNGKLRADKKEDIDMENKKMMCPICKEGFLEDEISDYVTVVKDGTNKISITVKNLKRKRRYLSNLWKTLYGQR